MTTSKVMLHFMVRAAWYLLDVDVEQAVEIGQRVCRHGKAIPGSCAKRVTLLCEVGS